MGYNAEEVAAEYIAMERNKKTVKYNPITHIIRWWHNI
jgi:hypothetical protein